MNNRILTTDELKGYGYGDGYLDRSGYGYGYGGYGLNVLYEYFDNLKIYVPYNFPTSVLNYCNEMIDNYE